MSAARQAIRDAPISRSSTAGRSVRGVRIHPAEALREHQPDVIVIFSMAYEQEIRESFARLGLKAELVSATALVRADAR